MQSIFFTYAFVLVMKKVLLLLYLGFSLAIGQDLEHQFKSVEDELSFYLLDVEQGLSNDAINTIEQDSLGFIWVGTEEGLNRYDGTQFSVFKSNNNSENTNIIGDFIEQIKYIGNSELLMVTTKGVSIYNSKNETFRPLHKQDLEANTITCFDYGNAGEYFTGAYNRGVTIITKKDTIFYPASPEAPSLLSSSEITSIAQQGDSILWVGTARHGLNKINYIKNTVSKISFNGDTEFTNRINTLYIDKSNNLWIGSKGGLQTILPDGSNITLEKSLAEGSGLSDSFVTCFEEDNSGRMWIGTKNGGLNIINKQAFLKRQPDFYVKWYLPKDDGSSVFNRTVSSLKFDNSGNMWIGTSTGLNFVNPEGEPIKLLQYNSSKPNALSHSRIGALAQSSNGNIYIGTDGAGLDVLNPIKGTYAHHKHSSGNSSSLSNDYIIALLEDSKQRLWIGTYQGGLNKMDVVTGTCNHYLQGGVEQGSDVRVIFETKKGQIWVGTNRGGLYRYLEQSDTFQYIEALGLIDVRAIAEDDNGFLWLATYGDGLLQLNTKTLESDAFNSKSLKGFTADIVFSVLVLDDGSILAGTLNSGLMLLKPEKEAFTMFTEGEGLSSNTITSMVKEDNTNIWLGTQKGISHYNPKTNEIYNLNRYTAVQQGKFNIGSGLITKSGIVYLGGDKGLNIFNPKNLSRINETYPIYFEKLTVLDEKVHVSSAKGQNIIKQSMFYENHIHLNHKQTFFSIDYAALKYPFVKNVMYAYRVEGYHDGWINTNTSGKVNLINLPHGSYTLNVKAKFGSGDEVVKKLFIEIAPPFWKTPLAYLCYVLLFVSALYGFLKYYTERVKLINSLKFEKKQRQLEHNFNEERVRFFTSFSHELKAPLTLILAPLEDLIKETKSVKHKANLKLIFKNAKQLLQSINRLLEFRKSNLGLSKLTVAQYNLTECLEQWVHNYYPLAKTRDIALGYEFPDQALLAWFDLEKLHIIVNNLLSNAFKYTDDKGEIHVSLQYDDEHFEIKVSDTGCGIPQNDLEHIFERYYQSSTVKSNKGMGIGLALSKNFTELHLGTIAIESQIKVGSIFTVSIPRDKKLFEKHISEASVNTLGHLDESGWDILQGASYSSKKSPNINIKENKELILVTDDSPDVLHYMEGLLGSNYDLIYAKDGEEGVQKALRYVPDLIVSDVMMPKMSGMELCKELKKATQTTHIPIILLTAKDGEESIKKGYVQGADDYIVKPFSSQVLQVRIRNLLDSRKQLRHYFLNNETVNVVLSQENTSLLEQEKAFLNQLEQIILKHLKDEKLDVWNVAKSIGMSRTSLFRKIKAITGLNINQYITKIKIDKAAQLIKSGQYTVAQASYEVGFNNVKYFRKLFKEQFGQLPSELSRNKSF